MKIPSALAVATVICIATTSGVPTASALEFKVKPVNSGVVYDPSYVTYYDRDVIETGIGLLKTNFKQMATRQVMWINANSIAAANFTDVTITPTVSLKNPLNIETEIEALCAAYERIGGKIIKAVFVGSDALKFNGNGAYSSDELIAYIERVRKCTGKNVKVGTAISSTAWTFAEGADKLAEKCNVIGVNIMPFEYPIVYKEAIDLLKEEWAKMVKMFGRDKLVLARTGLPHSGPKDPNHGYPSVDKAEKYLRDYLQWIAEIKLDQAFYYELFDTNEKDVDNPYLCGLYSASGVANVFFPGKSAQH